MQNLGCKSKGARGRGLRTLRKWVKKPGYFIYFRHLLHRMKNCKIYHAFHWHAPLVKVLLKLELINPFHATRSFDSPLKSQKPSDVFRGYQKRPVAWNGLRLIWGHLDFFQLIYRLTHLSSCRPILDSYRIILNIFRVFWVRLV